MTHKINVEICQEEILSKFRYRKIGNKNTNQKLNIACHYVHFTSIEDIHLKSSIPGQSSILRVTGRNTHFEMPD